MAMVQALGLDQGWKYNGDFLTSPKEYQVNSIDILDGTHSGWFYNAVVLSDSLELKVELIFDGHTFAEGTATDFFYGNNAALEMVPYCFMYNAYFPGISKPLYGMAATNNLGTPFTKNIKLTLSNPTTPFTVYALEYEYVEITDEKLFKQSIADFNGINELLKQKGVVPGVKLGGIK